MRSFGVISPQFWTGRTGKEIQACGAEAIVLATYLMTSPHSHMCGLYYLSKQYIVDDTGRPLKAVDKALKDLSLLPSGAFSFYDETSKWIWIPEMMRWQVGTIKPRDSRIGAIVKWYESLPSIPFINAFFDRYASEIPELQKRGISTRLPVVIRGVEGASTGGVGAERPPLSTLGLGLVPVLEGGAGETKPVVKSYGERGNVRLTEEAHSRLKEKLNGNLDDFIAELDCYAGVNPKRFKQYVDHEQVIETWFRKAVKEGKVKARASPEHDAAAVERERVRIFGAKAAKA